MCVLVCCVVHVQVQHKGYCLCCKVEICFVTSFAGKYCHFLNGRGRKRLGCESHTDMQLGSLCSLGSGSGRRAYSGVQAKHLLDAILMNYEL